MKAIDALALVKQIGQQQFDAHCLEDVARSLAKELERLTIPRPMSESPKLGEFIVKLDDGKWAVARRIKIANGVMMLIDGKFDFDMPAPVEWYPIPGEPDNQG